MAMAMVVMLIASSKAILVMLMASSMAIFTFFQLVFCSEALGTARHLIQYSHLACYIFIILSPASLSVKLTMHYNGLQGSTKISKFTNLAILRSLMFLSDPGIPGVRSMGPSV